MQFGKRAGDHTADAVLQMQRTMTASQLQHVAADIDRVLEKLEENTYGICDVRIDVA
jgi:RNA polymerase-binding transcription factor DksA